MDPTWKDAVEEAAVSGTAASLLSSAALALARRLQTPSAAAVTSAVAALVDFRLTPERFTPGFQHRVSTPALVGAYACFAAGLALGSMAMHRRREQRRIAD